MAENEDEQRPRGGVQVSAAFGASPSGSAQALTAPPPQRILVVGAFGGHGAAVRHTLDAAELAALPGRLRVTVDVAVPNRLGDAPAALGGRIAFDDIRDFAPKRIAERFVPLVEATRMAEAGTANGDDGRFAHLAAALRDGARDAGAPAPASPAPARRDDDESLNRLLGMVDAGTDEGSGGDDAAKRAISAFISSTGSRAAGSRTAGGPAAEALLAAQRAALFDDPGLRTLMETWQGLRLLTRTLARDSGLRVELVDIGEADIADAFAEQADIEVREGHQATPLALVVAAERPGAGTADLERARRIARAAEEMQVPAVISLHAEAGAGLDLPTAAARDEPGDLLDGPGFEIWNALRDDEAGRWLTVAWNDVLARTADAEGPALWIAPAWIVAAQTAASIARTGWPSEIVGLSAALDGFEVHDIAATGGRRLACATSALFSADACRSLADAGILVINGTPDRDEVHCLAAPTVHRPGRFPDDQDGRAARLLSSLPYQLAAARLAAVVAAARNDAAAGTPQATAEHIERALTGLLVTSGQGAGVAVAVEPHPDDPDRSVLAVRARTGAHVLGGEHFAFDVPV